MDRPFSKTKVIFNSENVKMCLCAKCPVQLNSACSKPKLKKLAEIEENSGDLPKKEDVPKLFCGSGPSQCKDLAEDECLCSNCGVWYKYFLAKERPSSYFCRYGRVR